MRVQFLFQLHIETLFWQNCSIFLFQTKLIINYTKNLLIFLIQVLQRKYYKCPVWRCKNNKINEQRVKILLKNCSIFHFHFIIVLKPQRYKSHMCKIRVFTFMSVYSTMGFFSAIWAPRAQNYSYALSAVAGSLNSQCCINLVCK